MYISEGRKEGVRHLLNVSWLWLEGVVSPFFSGEPVGRKHRNWFWCMLTHEPSISDMLKDNDRDYNFDFHGKSWEILQQGLDHVSQTSDTVRTCSPENFAHRMGSRTPHHGRPQTLQERVTRFPEGRVALCGYRIRRKPENVNFHV